MLPSASAADGAKHAEAAGKILCHLRAELVAIARPALASSPLFHQMPGLVIDTTAERMPALSICWSASSCDQPDRSSRAARPNSSMMRWRFATGVTRRIDVVMGVDDPFAGGALPRRLPQPERRARARRRQHADDAAP